MGGWGLSHRTNLLSRCALPLTRNSTQSGKMRSRNDTGSTVTRSPLNYGIARRQGLKWSGGMGEPGESSRRRAVALRLHCDCWDEEQELCMLARAGELGKHGEPRGRAGPVDRMECRDSEPGPTSSAAALMAQGHGRARPLTSGAQHRRRPFGGKPWPTGEDPRLGGIQGSRWERNAAA